MHLKDSEINRQSGLIQDYEAKMQEMDSLKSKIIVLEQEMTQIKY